MEATVVYWGYMGNGNSYSVSGLYGDNGIMEKKMETTIVHWVIAPIYIYTFLYSIFHIIFHYPYITPYEAAASWKYLEHILHI